MPAAPRSTTSNRAAQWVIVAVAYAVLLLGVYHRVVFGGQSFAWDCLLEYWPDLVFQTEALRSGELPWWNPYSLSGYAFVGDLQSGWLSPVNWLCIGLGYLAGTGPWLISVKVLVTMWVGVLSMHAFAYQRTRRHALACVAACTFLFGSPLLVHKNGALLWPLMYGPLLLLAVHALVTKRSVRAVAGTALAIWLAGTAGHPQGFFFVLLAAACYGSACAVVELWTAWQTSATETLPRITRFRLLLQCHLAPLTWAVVLVGVLTVGLLASIYVPGA